MAPADQPNPHPAPGFLSFRLMRFLIESGTYAIDNLGDVAMLQRTVRRLDAAFPGASIAVVTERPDRLRQVLPNAEPVPTAPWFRLRVVPVPRRWEYTPLVRRIRWREKLLAGHAPRLARAGKWRDGWADSSDRRAADAFYQVVQSADAVVAAGGGYINDFYHEHAWKVLATLNLAQGLRKPTAMFGIGLGPISRHDLTWHGGAVMRRLSVLALRESELGPIEARKLGVADDRVIITGDDAIAIAALHPVAPVEDRHHIGVNLRLAADAEVPHAALPRVRDAVLEVARRHGAELRPMIIRTSASPENDVDAAAQVFGADHIDLSVAREVSTPEHALAEIARCRVVVTGAYHNAVFALAMGVPVVGLGRSAYYLSKLSGVAQQFGTGMAVLNLSDPELQPKLASALARLWDEAPRVEPVLRTAAAEQIARGEAAYSRFLSQLRSKPEGTAA